MPRAAISWPSSLYPSFTAEPSGDGSPVASASVTQRWVIRQSASTLASRRPRWRHTSGRALASLSSGFMSPSELARAGLLRANSATQQKLAVLFGGPAPALADFF